jgi:hypothetical protein
VPRRATTKLAQFSPRKWLTPWPPSTGKIERFWGTLWRECLEAAVFTDLGEARREMEKW